MSYLSVEKNEAGVNIKHGRLQIELAVQGWHLATNTDSTPKEIEEGLAFAKAEGKSPDLETRVEDATYDIYGRVMINHKAIYYRGSNVEPAMPAEIVEEARKYLSMDKAAQLAFLRDFYMQIVLGKKGLYIEKFAEGRPETAAISNYFADNLRELGLAGLANKVEAKIREAFPKQGGNIYLVDYSP